MHKYPRTYHIEGSCPQVRDPTDCVLFERLRGRMLVVEEKMDGANSGVSFVDGELKLQSRGHYLSGGCRERQFDLFKQWAYNNADSLRGVLGDRYVMYGEWMYAKHAVFYDELPGYFMEFDVLDTVTGKFLNTPARNGLLGGLSTSCVPSVSVLKSGRFDHSDDLYGLMGLPSGFVSDCREDRFRIACERGGVDFDSAVRETDMSGLMEGIYIKVEEDGGVKERYKCVRQSFLQAVFEANGHWISKPIIRNRLRESAKLWG